MKRERKLREAPLGDVVSDAYQALVGLGEELRDWASNIEEKFGSTDKYQRLDDAASILEGLNEPTVAEGISNVKCEVLEAPFSRRGLSRPKRRDQAVYELDVAINVAQELMDKLSEKDEPAEEEVDQIAAAEELINELEELKSEAENVEFPGMYG